MKISVISGEETSLKCILFLSHYEHLPDCLLQIKYQRLINRSGTVDQYIKRPTKKAKPPQARWFILIN